MKVDDRKRKGKGEKLRRSTLLEITVITRGVSVWPLEAQEEESRVALSTPGEEERPFIQRGPTSGKRPAPTIIIISVD